MEQMNERFLEFPPHRLAQISPHIFKRLTCDRGFQQNYLGKWGAWVEHYTAKVSRPLFFSSRLVDKHDPST